MAYDLEKTVRDIYRRWKARKASEHVRHPDEEALAAFVEGRLSVRDAGRIRAHLLCCQRCSQAAAAGIRMLSEEPLELPLELAGRSAELLAGQLQPAPLSLVLVLKDAFLELVSASGDILVGQELMPAALVRSRNLSRFEGGLTVFKDFPAVRVELVIRPQAHAQFSVTVAVRDIKTAQPMAGVRASLLRKERELESHILRAQTAVFEHVVPGAYTVDIASPKERLAVIEIEVKAP